MAVYKVVDKVFNDPETGRRVDYKRLAITGIINNEIKTLELRVTNTEAMLAEMLIKSEGGDPEIIARKATKEESPQVSRTNNDDDWLNEE